MASQHNESGKDSGTYGKAAKYYDLIYSFKDYDVEAAKIREVIQREHSGARSILDVACGTGEHAKRLARNFSVDGLDIEPEFVKIAQSKLQYGFVTAGDMRNFKLARKYDVVQCLFSSIGYLTRGDDVIAALRCFSEHLLPGGIVIVEPWITPDKFEGGLPSMAPPVDKADIKICRMHVSERKGNISLLNFHYLVATRLGVERLNESHELALYSVEEMLAFFRAAGLNAEHDPVGIFGRGLYVARAL